MSVGRILSRPSGSAGVTTFSPGKRYRRSLDNLWAVKSVAFNLTPVVGSIVMCWVVLPEGQRFRIVEEPPRICTQIRVAPTATASARRPASG